MILSKLWDSYVSKVWKYTWFWQVSKTKQFNSSTSLCAGKLNVCLKRETLPHDHWWASMCIGVNLTSIWSRTMRLQECIKTNVIVMKGYLLCYSYTSNLKHTVLHAIHTTVHYITTSLFVFLSFMKAMCIHNFHEYYDGFFLAGCPSQSSVHAFYCVSIVLFKCYH